MHLMSTRSIPATRRDHIRLLVPVAVTSLAAACSATGPIAAADTAGSSPATTAAAASTSATAPTTATDTAPAGSDDACATFPDLSGVEGAGTGYALPEVSVRCSDTELVVTSNGMPGYTFEPKTPNALEEQTWEWHVPLEPQLADTTTTLAGVLGTVGFTVTGLPIYGPMEGPMPAAEAYGDPVYNGIVDGCQGHTGPASEYHVHAITATESCYLDEAIVGYAIDGFPIYGNSGTYTSGWVQTGDPTTDAWDNYTYQPSEDPNVLDECNGRIGEDGTYRYHRTDTFPYTIGCYAGTPVQQQGRAGGPMPAMR